MCLKDHVYQKQSSQFLEEQKKFIMCVQISQPRTQDKTNKQAKAKPQQEKQQDEEGFLVMALSLQLLVNLDPTHKLKNTTPVSQRHSISS